MKDLRGFAVNNYSFPELVEIRDYLKVHQIDNIRAVSVLFPNLAVIRGKRLYEKFALRITENKDLEEVGLTSLRYIENGNVHIEKNAKLCFSNTINWSAIAPSSNPRLNKIEVKVCATRCVNDANALQIIYFIRSLVVNVQHALISAGISGLPSRHAMNLVKPDFAQPMELAVIRNVSAAV